MSWEVASLCARSKASLDKLFSSSVLIAESLPTLVEASEVGVDDIALESSSKLREASVSIPMKERDWQGAVSQDRQAQQEPHIGSSPKGRF